jgi:hypothetical protein
MYQFKVNYDKDANTIFSRVEGFLTLEGIDELLETEKKLFVSLEHKAWYVSDITRMSSARIDIIKRYIEKSREFKSMYIIDYCIVVSQVYQKFAAMMYNMIKGESHPVFLSMQEAIGWVAKQQAKTGKYPPIAADGKSEAI